MTQSTFRLLRLVSRLMLMNLLPGILLCYVWSALVGPYLFTIVIEREIQGYPNLLGVKHTTIADIIVKSGAMIYPLLLSAPGQQVPIPCSSRSGRFIITYDTYFGKRCKLSPENEHVQPEFHDKLSRLVYLMIIRKQAGIDDLEKVIMWGVDVNRIIFDGITLFQIAMCWDRVDALNLLDAHGLRLDSDQIFNGAECAAIRGGSNSIKWLIDAGHDVQALTESEQKIDTNSDAAPAIYIVPAHSNLLHIACIFGRTETYEILKAAGLDQELVNARGQTPRDMCAWNPK